MKSGKKKRDREPKTPQYAVWNKTGWEVGGIHKRQNVVFHSPFNVHLRGISLLIPASTGDTEEQQQYGQRRRRAAEALPSARR